MALCAPWATVADVCGQCAETDDQKIEEWLMPASEYLYAVTGRQFKGQCDRVVRPCVIRRRPSITELRPGWGWRSQWFSFPPTNTWGFPWGYCGCFDGDPLEGSCACGPIPSISLGAAYVAAITEVKIGGVILDPATYRIDEHRLLTRLDGQRWPRTQNMLLDSTQANTFEVSFTAGRPLPEFAVRAAASLACELTLACSGNKACRLPRKAQSINRQGVSMQLRDVFGSKTTGLPEVDYFIQSTNPKGISRRAIVVNPDMLAPIRRI